MAKRKAAKKRVARRSKATRAGRKMRAGKKATPPKKRKRARRGAQPRVWRRTARLAQDAMAALDEGDLDEVRHCLQAVHAVAHCADQR
jgi:hypothetical protein